MIGLNRAVLALLILFLFGCLNKENQQKEKPTDISSEIDKLKTTELQKKYLEGIYALDQKVRTDGIVIETKFGYDSKESRKVEEMILEVDEVNLIKITTYLERYGHPKIDSHGELASLAPWLVIHHSSSQFEARRKFFNVLYKAYLDKDIEGSTFAFYLNRMYNLESGKRLDISGPFTEQMEIDTLLKLLEITID